MVVGPGLAILSPGRKVTSAGAPKSRRDLGIGLIPRRLGKESLEVTDTQDVTMLVWKIFLEAHSSAQPGMGSE